MNSDLSGLVGIPLQISRSNGRTHGAYVKTVDPVKFSVIVEWQERGQCLSKEVDLNDLCTLNPELQDYINSATGKSRLPPSPAPDRSYEGRLRSRIPAPSAYTRKSHRPTGLFQVPAVTAAPSLSVESARRGPQTVSSDIPPSVLITSAAANQKREGRQPAALPLIDEATNENQDPQNRPPAAKGGRVQGRRKTMAPADSNKANKRLSCLVKPPDTQIKRGKFGEGNGPNQKFYLMIQEFKETLEISPLSMDDMVETQKICVCVRKRPLNKQEVARKDIDVVSIPGKGTLLVHEPKQKVDLTKYLEN
ncbi:hypothetical protein CRUP_021264, partial [Coryphaenoides rupestris]